LILEKFKLDGRVAMVTGGSRGLGRGMAQALLQAGAEVVVVSRNNPHGDLAANGRRSLFMRADVSVVKDVDSTVDRIVGKFGHLDILLNAAGINLRGKPEEFTEEDWDRVMGVNLKGTFFCCRAAGRAMIRQMRGKIINIASLTSGVGVPGIPAYAASKGGVWSLTRALSVEWAKYNISVNAIGPGYFHTDMTDPVFKDRERLERIKRRIVMDRTGTPEDLMGTAVFLASAASDYITGQLIYVDGGYITS
jgi:2-deoxy-D-gluconate 3-dehydrogenase